MGTLAMAMVTLVVVTARVDIITTRAVAIRITISISTVITTITKVTRVIRVTKAITEETGLMLMQELRMGIVTITSQRRN